MKRGMRPLSEISQNLHGLEAEAVKKLRISAVEGVPKIVIADNVPKFVQAEPSIK